MYVDVFIIIAGHNLPEKYNNTSLANTGGVSWMSSCVQEKKIWITNWNITTQVMLEREDNKRGAGGKFITIRVSCLPVIANQ